MLENLNNNIGMLMISVKYITIYIAGPIVGLYIWKKKIYYEKKVRLIDNLNDRVIDSILVGKKFIEFIETMNYDIQIFKDSHKDEMDSYCALCKFIENFGMIYNDKLVSIISNIKIDSIEKEWQRVNKLKLRHIYFFEESYDIIYNLHTIMINTSAKLTMKSLMWQNPMVKKHINELSELNVIGIKCSMNKANKLINNFCKINQSIFYIFH